MCGTRETDWVDERGWPLDNPKLTPVGHKCHGCAQKEAFRKANFNNGSPPGVSVIFLPSEQVGPDGRIIGR